MAQEQDVEGEAETRGERRQIAGDILRTKFADVDTAATLEDIFFAATSS